MRFSIAIAAELWRVTNLCIRNLRVRIRNPIEIDAKKKKKRMYIAYTQVIWCTRGPCSILILTVFQWTLPLRGGVIYVIRSPKHCARGHEN